MEFVNAIASALMRASVQGCAALLVVGIICLAAPGIPPRLRSWMWRLAWLRVAYTLCTAAAIDLPILNKPLQGGGPAPTVEFTESPTATHAVPVAKQNDPPLPARAIDWSTILISAWALGVSAIGLWRLTQFLKARTLHKQSQLAPEALTDLLQEICINLRIRKPALAISDSVAGPLLVGVLHPRIILPSSFINAPAERLDFALRHELAHLQRKDLAWIYFVTAIQTALWFHPVVWWGARESRLVQEIACDELALRGAKAAAPFAEMLVELAQGKIAPSAQFAVGIFETKSTLRRRLNAMKALQTGKKTNVWVAGLTIAAIVGAIAPVSIVAEKEPPAAAPPAAKSQISTRRETEERVRIENLEKLKLELAELSVSYGDQHPSIVATKKKIALLEKELNAEEQPPGGAGNLVAGGGAPTSPQPMTYYMSNPELMKRYFPQMYAMAKQNGMLASGDATNNVDKKVSDREARLLKAQKESQRVMLRARSPGVVAQVLVKRGDHVKAGWELVRLNNEEADIRLRTAKAEFAIAETDYRLKHVLCEQQIADIQNQKDVHFNQPAEIQKLKLQLDRADAELELARAKFDSTRLEVGGYVIKAPADGIVDNLPAVGQTITPDIGSVGFFADPAE